MPKLSYVSNRPVLPDLLNEIREMPDIRVSFDIPLNSFESINDADILLIDGEAEELRTICAFLGNAADTYNIVLTGPDEAGSSLKLLESGADSVIIKDEQIVHNVVHALQGKKGETSYVSPILFNQLVDGISNLQGDNYDLFLNVLKEREIDLTLKEAEVAYYLKENLSNREIAKWMGITEGTVKVHVSSIYKKIGIRKRRAMVSYLQEIAPSSGEAFLSL